MTLVVAVATGTGTWLGGERMAGDFHYTEISGPKTCRLTDEFAGYDFAIGFAGSPRVAQAILSVHPPSRNPDGVPHSLEWWLHEYSNAIYDVLSLRGLIHDAHDGNSPGLTGDTGFVLATEGRVFLFDNVLSWEEPTLGYVAQGGAWSFFAGAYEVLREQHDPIDAARIAWPYVQKRSRIGDLVDETFIPWPPTQQA